VWRASKDELRFEHPVDGRVTQTAMEYRRLAKNTMPVKIQGTEKYFDVALRQSDYYTKDVGTWGGEGAESLGLKAEVESKDFVALANNKVPGTIGKRLTARMNKTRLEEVVNKRTGLPVINLGTGEAEKREVSNRRAGYDFTFSVPKSVSLYLALNDDKVLERMITEALEETMAAIENRIETKVRKGYQQENRISPNMVYAKFVHGQTRPVDGIPDPHYHIHVFAMNATFDEPRTVVGIDEGKIMFDKGKILRNGAALHIDQGIAVASHASQAKTVDQVIYSYAAAVRA